MESAYWMGKGKALENFPMLKSDGLVGGVVYYDGESPLLTILAECTVLIGFSGQHNDSRMNISLVMTAVQHGAVMANHVEVTALHKKPDATRGGQERICAATLKDQMTGEEWDVRCRVSPFCTTDLRQSHRADQCFRVSSTLLDLSQTVSGSSTSLPPKKSSLPAPVSTSPFPYVTLDSA